MPLLNGRSSADISLADALQLCTQVLSEAVALLYSPHSCQFTKVEDNHLLNSNGEAVSLQPIFEARIFNTQYELRWLNEQNGLGKAVLLSEESVTEYLSSDISQLNALDSIPQKYLLWGKGVEKQTNSNWGVLASARIGSLHVPISGITDGTRVYLNTCEYLEVVNVVDADGDKYGNVAVVEERLLNLEIK